MKKEIKEKFINDMIEDYQDVCQAKQIQKDIESSPNTISQEKSEIDVF